MRFLVIACALTFLMSLPASARTETGFLNRSVTLSGVTYRYQVYVPPQWTKSQSWPVILFLHGAGERGEDGLIQTEVGLAGSLRRHVERWPAIVVIPQCRKDVWWHSDPKMEAQAMAALERSIREFKGDRARVYLTGLSMGGYGTWAFGSRHIELFAALAPICGGLRAPGQWRDKIAVVGSAEEIAKRIGKTPVWIFHGDADPTVPVEESRTMRQALQAAGAEPRYTEYPRVGHNSWDKAYAEEELPRWLLSQRTEQQR
jgi:predicted peptidase